MTGTLTAYGSEVHIAVVMAVHRPDMVLLKRQISDIRSQDNVVVHLVAALDGPETSHDVNVIDALAGSDTTLIKLENGLGIRGAFVSALDAALKQLLSPDMLFAFADQDDSWRHDKLARCAWELRAQNAVMVHCDARIVTPSLRVIQPSLTRFENRQHTGDLLGNLLLNTVTGMTAVFTRNVAERVVTLSAGLTSNVLHDHLTAVAAASLGRIVTIADPLVDYVQHGGNSLGSTAWKARPLRKRAMSPAALGQYNRTSAAIYEDRREIVLSMEACGVAEYRLRQMFLVNAMPGPVALVRDYIGQSLSFARSGHSRLARITLRLLYAAIERRKARR